MATFEIEADGKTFEVEAPDQATAIQTYGKFRQMQAPSGNADAITRGLGGGRMAETTQAATGPMDRAVDAAKSFGSGVSRGVSGMIGLPATVEGWIDAGVRKAPALFGGKEIEQRDLPGQSVVGLPTAKGVQGAIESVIPGAGYEPQFGTGRFAQTIGEFAPGSLLGPGGMARNAVNFGVVPAVASETAGQLTHGTALETPARLAAGIIAGGGAAALNRPASSVAMLERSAAGITPQQAQAAEALFADAQRMGTPITWAEAIQGASRGATRMGDLQRVVEGQGGMRDFFANRVPQNDAAARRVFDDIGPASNVPSSVGPAAGAAAESTIQDVRRTINARTEPMYTAAEAQRIPAADMAQIRATPGWAEASAAVRNDPQLNRYVSHLPDDSVGFLNEVKKYFDAAAENAAGPLNAQRNQQRAAGYGSDARAVEQAAGNVSPEYRQAVASQAALRQTYLDPLMQGPLGKMAARDTTTKQAVEALFPTNPLPGSADEVTTAVSALTRRNSMAARQLVRAHAEMTFNEAAQNLQGGLNQFGGASFASQIRGNSQQATNLEAAVRALPNGDQTWQGFNRLLDVFEAQGTRQRIGSQTAFNQEAQAQLKRGGPAEAVGKVASGGFIQWPKKALEAVENWRMGRNVDQLASLLTDPQAAGILQSLAQRGGRPGEAIAIRLAMLGGSIATGAEQRSNATSKR